MLYLRTPPAAHSPEVTFAKSCKWQNKVNFICTFGFFVVPLQSQIVILNTQSMKPSPLIVFETNIKSLLSTSYRVLFMMLPLGMAIYGFYACYAELSQHEWYNPVNLILGGVALLSWLMISGFIGLYRSAKQSSFSIDTQKNIFCVYFLNLVQLKNEDFFAP